jgi:hypothetical protein
MQLQEEYLRRIEAIAIASLNDFKMPDTAQSTRVRTLMESKVRDLLRTSSAGGEADSA